MAECPKFSLEPAKQYNVIADGHSLNKFEFSFRFFLIINIAFWRLTTALKFTPMGQPAGY